MKLPYELSAEADQDLFEIWQRIALDSIELADRIESEFWALFQSLGRMPGQGHFRSDLTKRPVRFFSLYSFVIVYWSTVTPIRIVAILRGKRDIKRILLERL